MRACSLRPPAPPCATRACCGFAAAPLVPPLPPHSPTLPAPPAALRRKPSGAYIFYCNAKRDDVKREFPGLSVAQVGKALGQMWKSETEEGKKVRSRAAAQA